MERITSRQNSWVRHCRALAADPAYRRRCGEFLCDGEKLLREALAAGAEITAAAVCGAPPEELPPELPVYSLTEELFRYVSPLENSPGPLFTVRSRRLSPQTRPDRVLVLENIQDPGNVGTILRTAAALRTDLVLLTGACADPYGPKAVRATMGAVFRQPLLETDLAALPALLDGWELPLWGAALAEDARDIREVSLRRAAVAVGNEGKGLSAPLLALCGQKVIIPMAPGSESLNAAVAASVVMWEMFQAQ